MFTFLRNPRLQRVIASGAALFFALSPALAPAASPPASTGTTTRRSFPRSIRALPTTATDTNGVAHAAYIARTALTVDEEAAETPFEIALTMRNFDELRARIAHSEIISHAELEARYLPSPAVHDRMVRWLQSEGLAVTSTSPQRLAIFGRGKVSEVARVFQTSFARVAAQGKEYTSAITAPSLPNEVAGAVLGLHGLQAHIRPKPLHLPSPQATTGGSLPYYPSQINKAYGSSSLGLTGSGQTIAIYSFAFPATSDLTKFWTTTGSSASSANVQNIVVGDGPIAAPDSGIIDEASLDVEWASGMAPGAIIRVYGGAEDSPVSDDQILQQVLADTATNPNMHQLSISYGLDEDAVDKDYSAITAQYMAAITAVGVTVFASSGDNGALSNDASHQMVGLPASVPEVTAVGGTSLRLDLNNNVSSEIGWGSPADAGSTGSSGGGVSTVFLRPSWQTGAGVPAGTMRLIPDVSAVGDPATGAYAYSQGKSGTIGGTSLSSPIWAAWCAMINQYRANNGKGPLGALNPRIYPLAGTLPFRDIVAGGNSVFSASTGYDLVTGIGSPVVIALAQASTSETHAPYLQVQTTAGFATTLQPESLYVFAGGSPAPTYRWQRRAVGTSTWSDLANGSAYAGVATSNLIIRSATASMNGDQFQCIVANSAGSVTSTPIPLTVASLGVTTLAGWPDWSGSADGLVSNARFSYPGGVRIDAVGTAYVTDARNNTIRKITPDGTVTTIAGLAGFTGTADGTGSAARFNGPGGVAVDSSGNLFVVDSESYTVRKITPAGVVTTFAGKAGIAGTADGTGTGATFGGLQNIAIDTAGNLYVADGGGNTIRKITPAAVVTTFAGLGGTSGNTNGTGTAARFNNPSGLAVDTAGNVYVADNNNNSIRKITPAGVVTTLAGRNSTSGFGFVDGDGTSARFDSPASVAVDSVGNVYVADSYNCAIRKITPGGTVSTIAGNGDAFNTDGPLSSATFYYPADLAVDPAGNLLVADAYNNTIRRVTINALTVPNIAASPITTTINSGQNATFTVTASGSGPFTYQWQLLPSGSSTWSNLSATSTYSGVTSTTLTVAAATVLLDSTQYRCVVTNVLGSTNSAAASLLVNGTPIISAASQSQAVRSGTSITLNASASGRSLTYQWLLNGAVIAGATSSTYTIANFSSASAGTYSVTVSNTSGSVTSAIGTLTLSTAYLTNLSVRNRVGTGDDVLVVGFVIAGSDTKTLLIRGAGPVLTQYFVAGALANPVLSLAPSGGNPIAVNTGWGNDPALTTAFAQVAAFPFPTSSADTALLRTLSPGGYSAKISGANNTTGVALAELYDESSPANARLTNVSARAPVGTGDNVMIVGFVIGGTGSDRLLIRGIGPTLKTYGVSGVLERPELIITDTSGNVLASNSGWADDTTLAGVFKKVAAFDLTPGSADAAVFVTLPAGGYSAKLSGANATTGNALVELYEVP